MYDADVNLLTNPGEEDDKFLSYDNDFFEGVCAAFQELPIYRVYRNKIYYVFTNAYKVRHSQSGGAYLNTYQSVHTPL